MVVIRLARGGSKKSPFYHIVAADKRRARDSKYIERLGYFNPVARGEAARLTLEMPRIEHWVGLGAQPSERVKALIADHKRGGPKPKKVKKPKVEAKAEAEKPAEAVKAEDKPAETKAEDKPKDK